MPGQNTPPEERARFWLNHYSSALPDAEDHLRDAKRRGDKGSVEYYTRAVIDIKSGLRYAESELRAYARK